jgi:hypothetical protein
VWCPGEARIGQQGTLTRISAERGIRLVAIAAARVGIRVEGGLLGFVEDAIHVLFATRRKTMQRCERKLFLKPGDTLRKGSPLGLQRSDFRRTRRQKRHQFRNGRGAGSIDRILES